MVRIQRMRKEWDAQLILKELELKEKELALQVKLKELEVRDTGSFSVPPDAPATPLFNVSNNIKFVPETKVDKYFLRSEKVARSLKCQRKSGPYCYKVPL